jgi:hypothetical protein
MARLVCRIVGVALLVLGLAGFASPTFLGLHLTTVHDIVHLLTALVALYIGFAATLTAARIFCLVFGAGYLLLAVAGIAMPGLVASILGHAALTSRELTPDNAVHAVLGAALLVVGLRAPKTVVRTF